MHHRLKASVVAVLCGTLVGAGVAGSGGDSPENWNLLASASKTAKKSGHYIYVDQPDIAVRAIQRVASKATRRSHGR